MADHPQHGGDRAREVTFTRGTLGTDKQDHPLKATASRRSAADVFQDLIGIPRLGAGSTRVTMDLLIPWLYARQADLPNHYIGNQNNEQRVAVVRVLLGANDETVDALRREADNADKEWKSVNSKVKKIVRSRKERELPTVEDLQRRELQWSTRHQELSETARQAGADLSRLHAELAGLEKKVLVADEARRAARATADDRERAVRQLEAVASEARGVLPGCGRPPPIPASALSACAPSI